VSVNRQSHSSFPILGWFFGYQKEWLQWDLIAGLITAAVVIPKAMAYATIAGLPVQVGLYTVLVPMAIYAVVGTSRPLSVSTTTTLAILVAAEFGQVAEGGDPASLMRVSATLTLLVGAILLLAALLRLGFIANFISEPVLIGFKAGIALVIVLDQAPKLLGVHFPKGTFVHNLLATLQAIPHASLPTLIVGIAWGPGHRTDEFHRDDRCGGRAFATSEEPHLRPNQELAAIGLANAGGALLGAMPAGGGTTQTAVNRLAGARTQLAELITAAVALLTMLFLAPLIALMPQATLAAVVIVYSIGLIKPVDFRHILEIRRAEFLWALTALAGVVLLGTLQGILVAIVVSLVALASQTADPPVRVLGRKPGTDVFRPRSKEHPEDETFPGLLMLQVEGRVFFVNAERIAEKMKALADEAKPRVVALDFSGVPDLEYTALKMLIEAEKRERESGVAIWLVGLNPEVLSVIQRSSLGKTLGRERMHFNLELAVAKYLAAPVNESAA
jgi:sulfate permease, SulP family